jgi:hypothetical protein
MIETEGAIWDNTSSNKPHDPPLSTMEMTKKRIWMMKRWGRGGIDRDFITKKNHLVRVKNREGNQEGGNMMNWGWCLALHLLFNCRKRL